MPDNPQLDEARKVFEIAKALAPSNSSLTSFLPFLRAAIPYFRLLANTSDLAAAVEAHTGRIECEDAFRNLVGRSFLVEQDHLSYEEALALSTDAKHS